MTLAAKCLPALFDGYRVALQRVAARQEVIRDLIDGQIALREAATRFRSLAPNPSGGAGVSWSDAADDESLCRTVIGWVHLALLDRPERAEEVSESLEQTLQSYVRTMGNAFLPR